MNKRYRFAFNGLVNQFSYQVDHYVGTSYSKPLSVCALVTKACNVKCKQCDIWYQKTPVYGLTTNEWKYIIKKVHTWLGTFYIDFSGGEPLLRDDIFDLIQYSNNLGILTTTITNCYLVDKNRAKKIIESKLDKIIISIDGLGKTHDYSRGVKGLFKRIERSLKIINNLKKRYNSKLEISINTMITKYNLHEIDGIIKFAVKNNCSIYFRPLLPVYSTMFKNDYYINSEIWPSNHSEVSEVIDNILMMKKDGAPITNYEKYFKALKLYFKNPNLDLKNLDISCKAPFRYLCINTNGDVKVCGKILGNMLRDRLIDIRKKLNELRGNKKNCGRFCGLSDYMWTVNTVETKRLWRFLRN